MTMPDLAQTNIQLVREMVAAGWTDDDLLRLRTAYELDMWAFSGQYRANGKTQLAHHVGTASALLRSGARPALVIAGLAHSLYFLGEFGTGRRGPHAEKRAVLRPVLGAEVEQLVLEYTAFPWDRAAVERMTTEAATATDERRDVVAMRVANEVDEWADAAMRFSHELHAHDLGDAEGLDAVVAIADAHGLSALGALLREVATAGVAMRVPDVLVSVEEHTVFVPPASYRRRLHVALQDSRVGHGVAARVPGARRAAGWVRAKLG